MKTSLIKALAFGGFISGAAAFMFVGCGEAGSGALSKQAFDISVQDYDFVTPAAGNNTGLCTIPQFQIRFKNQMACQVNSAIQDMVAVFDQNLTQKYPLNSSYPVKDSATTCLYNFSPKSELPPGRTLKFGVYANTGSTLSVLPNTVEFTVAQANATTCKGQSSLDVWHIDGTGYTEHYKLPPTTDYGSIDENTGNIVFASNAESLMQTTLYNAVWSSISSFLFSLAGFGMEKNQNITITFTAPVDLRTVKASIGLYRWSAGVVGADRNFSVRFDNSDPNKAQNSVVIVTPESDGWTSSTLSFVVISRSLRGANGVPMFQTVYQPTGVKF
ncbi:MAG: hypothetical protein J0L93_01650 [Deltaproteobacteria bacterium]|nr:hypothetical protein [Deltaproteobacteria bacterium]